MLTNDTQKLDGLRTYIDGKMRRFNLLFAVNGGAFAIAKLMTETDKSGNDVVLGDLKLWHLAVGSTIFTLLIVADNYLWAERMRKNFLGDLAFNAPGKVVLLSLGILIISAWSLVAMG